MTVIVGVDPGPVESGVVVWRPEERRIEYKEHLPNEKLRELIYTAGPDLFDLPSDAAAFHSDSCFVIEKIVSYGMRVGETTFSTAYWIGRFVEALAFKGYKTRLLSRPDVKLAICYTTRASDADVRDALLAKFGPKGSKKEPGILYGVSGHCWSALAVAVAASMLPEGER